MDSAMMNRDVPAWFASYAKVRTDGYVALASLLSRTPSEDLMGVLQNLTWDRTIPTNLDEALMALRQAGRDSSAAAAADEFDRLFVGLGSGEVVPYASWYREKRLQALPLALLRSDLMKLGIVRQAGSHESEDHAGALCEIMALITRKQGAVPRETQAQFFRKHLDPWMIDFFRDLQPAKSAQFYRMVGRFGICFLECERQFLNYREDNQAITERKGGSRNEKRGLRRPADVSEECGVL